MRTILHSDMNNFYASVECLYDSRLRDVPMAVGGDVEQRHGIVLSKNEIAKKFGVQTGEPLWAARQKCSEIQFVRPNFDRYLKYAHLSREIYARYTDQIETMGLDEAWLDVTGSGIFGSGEQIADSIRRAMKDELGLTVSVGVSFNKIFAKLGSDMRKPDAVTVITDADYREKVWCQPVGNLLYCGRSTVRTLARYAIFTIGDLARADRRLIGYVLGKNGLKLWNYANGLDSSAVRRMDEIPAMKSVGNSTTTPRDLVSDDDVRTTLWALCEKVSARLRRYGFCGRMVSISVRDSDLCSYERQVRLGYPTCNARDLFEAAYAIFCEHHDLAERPVRSLGVRVGGLCEQGDVQLSFMPDISRSQRSEQLERAVDGLRGRYGHGCVTRGLLLCDFDHLTDSLINDKLESEDYF